MQQRSHWTLPYILIPWSFWLEIFRRGDLNPYKPLIRNYTLPTQRGLATTMQFTKILCTLVVGACYGTSSPAPDGNCSSASDNIALIQRQASVQAHSADPSSELTNVESASAQSITSPTQVPNRCANILEISFRTLFNTKLYVPTPSNPHPPLHSHPELAKSIQNQQNQSGIIKIHPELTNPSGINKILPELAKSIWNYQNPFGISKIHPELAKSILNQ